MNKWLPTRREAIDLLCKTGCSSKVISHCKAVTSLALEIAEELKKEKQQVDIHIVEIGALLHDVGRSQTHSIHHAIKGSEIAQSFNIDPRIVSIIERHVGGGITDEEAGILGWPKKSYRPKNIEQKIVTYTDKLIEGDKRVPIINTKKKLEEKLGKNHTAIRMIENLHKEMSFLLKDSRII